MIANKKQDTLWNGDNGTGRRMSDEKEALQLHTIAVPAHFT